MSEIQRNAIPQPAEGLLIFNTTTKCFNFFKNGMWFEICGNCITPQQPGNISGTHYVCPGQQGMVYSITPVNGASGYLWNVPSGAMIVSGQNTTSITVDFGNSGGQITVSALNSCGGGPASATNIIMGAPLLAGSIGGGSSGVCGNDGITNDPAAFSSITPASQGTGNISYQWQSKAVGGTYSDIPGATQLTYDPPAISQSMVYSRKASDSCTTVTSNEMTVTWSAGCGNNVCQNANVVHQQTTSVSHMELLGMKFTPLVNGSITRLGLRTPQSGIYTLNLFNVATQVLERSVSVNAVPNTWVYSNITPYNVNAGQSVYCVLVLPANHIYAYGNFSNPPIISGNVQINGGCWYNSPSGPNLFPNSYANGQIYGVTDITFTP